MEQRNSMNITNTVASDVFGDMAEGNVGDFLRNMPGIDLELTQGEVRNIRSEPVITMQKNGDNPAVAQTYEVTGTIWTFGAKGVF